MRVGRWHRKVSPHSRVKTNKQTNKQATAYLQVLYHIKLTDADGVGVGQEQEEGGGDEPHVGGAVPRTESPPPRLETKPIKPAVPAPPSFLSLWAKWGRRAYIFLFLHRREPGGDSMERRQSSSFFRQGRREKDAGRERERNKRGLSRPTTMLCLGNVQHARIRKNKGASFTSGSFTTD